MIQQLLRPFLALCLVSSLSTSLLGQTILKGVVLDGETEETIIGAQIRVLNTEDGTISDFDGNFTLETSTDFPLQVRVSSAGFEEVLLTFRAMPVGSIDISMTPVIDLLSEVVIAASRIEESLLSSPGGIEKINLAEYQTLPQADMFKGLSLARGVQMNFGSYSAPSINTRGFTDAQNWRFLQYVDGMEVTSPGLGYAFGNNSGPGDLDIRYIEMMAGPGSALYGPNAFNGIMAITTKDPFLYPGLSARIKGGIMSQEGISSNPFLEVDVRYAARISDQLAYKINLGYLSFTDWTVDDNSYHITPERAPFKDQLLAIDPGFPTYDAVSRFGDEIAVPVFLGPDSSITVNRTGIPEKDIVNYDSRTIKLGAGIYYQPEEDLKVSYDVRYFQGDGILRHTTVYPLRNIAHFMQKLEVKGKDFFIRAYHSQEDANDSYAILGTGAFIQEGLKSSVNWSQDYGLALRGEIPGISAGDPYSGSTIC